MNRMDVILDSLENFFYEELESRTFIYFALWFISFGAFFVIGALIDYQIISFINLDLDWSNLNYSGIFINTLQTMVLYMASSWLILPLVLKNNKTLDSYVALAIIGIGVLYFIIVALIILYLIDKREIIKVICALFGVALACFLLSASSIKKAVQERCRKFVQKRIIYFNLYIIMLGLYILSLLVFLAYSKSNLYDEILDWGIVVWLPVLEVLGFFSTMFLCYEVKRAYDRLNLKKSVKTKVKDHLSENAISIELNRLKGGIFRSITILMISVALFMVYLMVTKQFNLFYLVPFNDLRKAYVVPSGSLEYDDRMFDVANNIYVLRFANNSMYLYLKYEDELRQDSIIKINPEIILRKI